jgi:hypothetical protein
MTPPLDCLVSYFGLDEEDQAEFRRHFCYHILAGAGPTSGTGVATITAVAVHDRAERCTSCQNFHLARTGGPAAAIAAAVRYLDAYHQQDHLWKVQSDVRHLHNSASTESAVTCTPPVRTSLSGTPPAPDA